LPTQAFPASGRQGAKKSFLRKKLKKVSSDFAKNQKFYEIHEIFKNFMILDMSESLVFLRKYYAFSKKQGPLGGQAPKSAFLGAIRPFLGFWAPNAPPSQNH